LYLFMFKLNLLFTKLLICFNVDGRTKSIKDFNMSFNMIQSRFNISLKRQYSTKKKHLLAEINTEDNTTIYQYKQLIRESIGCEEESQH
jgi:hypothetical protein